MKHDLNKQKILISYVNLNGIVRVTIYLNSSESPEENSKCFTASEAFGPFFGDV